MHEVSFDRLSLERRALIFYCMKKAPYTVPTLEELYALEKRARQARARHVALLIRSAYDRIVSALSTKVVRHA